MRDLGFAAIKFKGFGCSNDVHSPSLMLLIHIKGIWSRKCDWEFSAARYTLTQQVKGP